MGINSILSLLDFPLMKVSKATEFYVNVLSWVYNRYSCFTHFMEHFFCRLVKSKYKFCMSKVNLQNQTSIN